MKRKKRPNHHYSFFTIVADAVLLILDRLGYMAGR